MGTLDGFPNPRHLPPALPPPCYARPRAMVRAEQSSPAPHAVALRQNGDGRDSAAIFVLAPARAQPSLIQSDVGQVGFRHAKKVAGLVQQRDANLLAQILRIHGHALEIFAKEQNLRDLWRAA